MWKEFKTFMKRGNVLDLAVGVVIGGAFTRIVNSLVNDILMPVIGLLIGKVRFDNLFITLGKGNFTTIEEAKAADVATINYGLFINNVLSFVITAFAIFILIRQINRFHKLREKHNEQPIEEPKPVTTKACSYCFSTIHIEAIKCPHCTADLD